ncbi:hypothetical protein J31TS4_09780 [Paenibacillus sp. J31TS4]|nr:hypothetical protein J31TS4_09780 [Paenibacillus sp. J31TS4]
MLPPSIPYFPADGAESRATVRQMGQKEEPNRPLGRKAVYQPGMGWVSSENQARRYELGRRDRIF